MLDDGVDDLGRAIGPTDVVVRPGRLHVRLVVQAFESVEGVAGGDRLGVRSDSELFHRWCADTEETVEQHAERLLAAGQCDPRSHVVGESERVVPASALVEGRIDQEPCVRVERHDPLGRHRVQLAGEVVVADVAGDLGGAVVAEGEVERVGDRVGDASFEELLAVVASQVVVHVHQRPVPVDVGDAERSEVGEERVGQCTALP